MRLIVIGFHLSIILLLIQPHMAIAQDIRWRTDYTAARKEATTSGKTLLLDFGTEACSWCRKLDATTFHDPKVVALLNERFIPVKVDGDRNEWLTRTAAVQAFPTLIVLGSDGKVLARQEGFVEADKLNTILKKALSAAAPIAATQPSPISTEATPAAGLLTLARADYSGGRYLNCVERCDKIVTLHASSPEVAEARRILQAVTSDPKKWNLVTGALQAEVFALQKEIDAALGKAK